jgi:tetratricopeptide (TPR) repeat protein
MTRIATLFALLFALSNVLAQYPPEVSKGVDSLKLLLSSAKSDTTKLELLRKWDDLIYPFNPQEDSTLNIEMKELAGEALKKENLSQREKFLFHQAIGFACNSLGLMETARGRFGDAVGILEEGLLHYTEAGDERGVSKIYLNLSNVQINAGNLDLALDFARQALKINRAAKNDMGICSSLEAIGKVYVFRGDLDSALLFLQRAERRCSRTGIPRNIASSHNSLGNVYLYKGNMPLAMEHYTEALRIFEEAGMGTDAIGMRVNIGNVHVKQRNYPKAIECYAKILEDTYHGSPMDIALANHGTGSAYGAMGKLDSAFIFFRRSAEISKANGLLGEYTVTILDMGTAFQKMEKYDSAFLCFREALELNRPIGNKMAISSALNGIAFYYVDVEKFDSAAIIAQEVYSLAQEIGSRDKMAEAARLMYTVHKSRGNSKQALRFYREHVTIQRELFNEENQRKILEDEFQLDYDVKHAKDSVASALRAAEAEKVRAEQIKASDAEIARKEIQQFFLIGGLVFVFAFALVILNRFKLARRQKHTIELQHGKLEEKNKEIFDSITYAKRIQDAILPPTSMFNRIWPDAFIFYRPKDIVAGDFYWLEETNEHIFLAVADCTGHGVPGAMVSVVCHNALIRSVREYGLKKPGEILDKTRELVIETLDASDSEVKDGMDISLVGISKKSGEIQFSGANNDLFVLRSDSAAKGEDLLQVVKCNKQPVGRFSTYESFSTNRVEVKKGDCLYLFSDGYSDQFGGDKGKKLKMVNFRKILTGLMDVPMKTQATFLEKEFDNWRGEFEQIDDVCVVGIRI